MSPMGLRGLGPNKNKTPVVSPVGIIARFVSWVLDV